ncbi:MAG: cytochrome c oxidase assembly protein [Solirubrobacteraceae bacterium]
MRLELDPVVLVLLALGAGLYVRAIRTLAARGHRVPAGRQACWWVGWTLLVAGLVSPIGAYAEDLLSLHMAEHLLIGDLAAPFLVAGLRSPVLLFYLPRPVLVALARRHGLRRAFRWIRRPIPALALYVAVLYGWHLAPAFEAAASDPLVHVLQHQCFLAVNLLIWWVVLEPQRMRFPADLWKVGYVFAARMASLMMGMLIVMTRAPIYADFYGNRPREYGLSPLADQQIGAGLMMVVDVLMIMGTLAYVFWKAAEEADRQESEQQRPAPPAAMSPGPGPA